MLQLHSEQYYIKGGDRIGAFGINPFTEDENSKIKKDRRKKKEHRTEPTKFTIAVYQKTVTDRLLANIITD